MANKIRIGIELNHVIRNINFQIAKYYQKDYDDSVDLDEIDYKDDILNTICKFNTKTDRNKFLYELYPLEIFGHANQIDRTLSRDLNKWINELTNQEDYDVEIFFYSLKEGGLTIGSTYFFLSKIGTQVRKMVFPKSVSELMEYGDVFITSNADVLDEVINSYNKNAIVIRMNFNKGISNLWSKKFVYDDFKSFLDDTNKLNNMAQSLGLTKENNHKECNENKRSSSMTWMPLWISSLLKKIGW